MRGKTIRQAVDGLERRFDARRYLEQFEPKGSEDNLQIECPKCGKAKLYVYVAEDDPEKHPGTWICFSCSDSGGALDLVRLLEGGSLFQAVEILKEHSTDLDRTQDLGKAFENAVRDRFESASPQKAERGEEPLPEGFVPCTKSDVMPSYFYERGVGRLDAVRRKLGWCENGYFSNRLIVPVYDGSTRVWFQARWMAKVPPFGKKKYLNSKNSDKRRDLYGIDLWRRCRRIVLVEDVFSAMWLGQGAAATFGTDFSREQLSLLASTEAREVVVCWDEDALDKAHALAGKLSELFKTSVAALPRGKDPDDLPKAEVWRLIEEAPAADSFSAFEGAARTKMSRI